MSNVVNGRKLRGLGEKQIIETNYVPEEIAFSTSWLRLLDTAEQYIRRRLRSFRALDPYHYEVMDGEFSCMASREIHNGERQYIRHVRSIRHLADIAAAKTERARMILKDLQADIDAVESEEQQLLELRKEYERRHSKEQNHNEEENA